MQKLVIQSDKSAFEEVENYLSVFCDEKHIYDYYGTILMPVLQAVENAIVHGNGSDPNKQVVVETQDCFGGILLSVEDQGNGFDYTQYGDLPLEDGKGEGIFLMKALSDQLTFLKNGRRVEMKFLIKGIDASKSIERSYKLQHFFDKKRIEA